MNPLRNRAVAALERWRRFEEARAAIAHRAAELEVVKADQAHAQAEALAQDVERNRAMLLACPTIDLDRCRAVGEIEAHAWTRVAEREAALAQARDVAAQALQAHRGAHAMTDVASQRRERLDSALEEHLEKATSDRLAELRNAVARTSP